MIVPMLDFDEAVKALKMIIELGTTMEKGNYDFRLIDLRHIIEHAHRACGSTNREVKL